MMEKAQINNPFVVGRYVSDPYFCDRQEETAFLTKQIENMRNVALISPRRLGKTGLILHCMERPAMQETYYTFFIDIYATTSLAEFVFLLGKSIYEQLKPRQTIWKETFFQIIKSLRIGLKWDAAGGEASFDLSLGDIQTPQTTLDEIFAYLESANKPCLVAIDEFQQIGTYAESNVEALLRTKIQQCRQTRFIFAGSKRHLMNNMFNTSSKPFYQSAISMGLAPIAEPTYVDFACRLFAAYDKEIDAGVIETVYRRFDGYTWFVQMMMNELFALTDPQTRCTKEALDVAFRNVVQAQDGSYKELLSRLAPKQKLLLLAIAKEGVAQGLTSAAFIKKHRLQSASSVQSALKYLIKDEWLMQDGNSYRIYDFFLREWLIEVY